ncbi:SDR family oxidoreductase [Candidatus Parcubacteria bacterium]|jgi:NAD(P)-dependent dehydrogenase (short-subunit alcohol dehydrogenase family)|nr:MAG: SDR family oxidoreductase [Candidatus Parcubacteria bacterium]
MGLKQLFDLSGRVTIITGGAGLLGVQHAEVIAEAGGFPVLADINKEDVEKKAEIISEQYYVDSLGIRTDITKKSEVEALSGEVLKKFGRIDILINNAANNPKVKAGEDSSWNRFENFPIELWNQDIAVGLTGAFLCSKVIGSEMAKRGGGVILNISSDLGVIAPDQRIYFKEGLPAEKQSVKPVSYSVVKHGLIGLTKYLATYWADKNIRVNAVSPGGVYTGQSPEFVKKLRNLIPLGRMANKDEYKAAILFLVSDASSYMTGANLIIDGGRSCW